MKFLKQRHVVNRTLVKNSTTVSTLVSTIDYSQLCRIFPEITFKFLSPCDFTNFYGEKIKWEVEKNCKITHG